jgi:hypothetical protein
VEGWGWDEVAKRGGTRGADATKKRKKERKRGGEKGAGKDYIRRGGFESVNVRQWRDS